MDSRPRYELMYCEGETYQRLHASVLRMRILGFEPSTIRMGKESAIVIIDESETDWPGPCKVRISVAGVPVSVDPDIEGDAILFDYE